MHFYCKVKFLDFRAHVLGLPSQFKIILVIDSSMNLALGERCVMT